MLKLIAAIRRKPGLSHAECIDYLKKTHASLASAKPLGVKKYVQSYVFDASYGHAADVGYPPYVFRDSVTELYFESMSEMGRTFSDSYTREVIGPDGRNFSDLRTAIGLLTRETVLQKPKPSKSGIKVMQFIRLRDGHDLKRLTELWQGWHGSLAETHKAMIKTIKGHVRAIRTPEGDPFLAYFGGQDATDFHGVASFWFENEKPIASFNAYHRAFMQKAALSGDALDQSASFIVHTRENTVMDFT